MSNFRILILVFLVVVLAVLGMARHGPMDR